jgi:hypothetical protein
MTGFSGDIVTVDAVTDEGWYFTGMNVTGAVATGNKFMFVGENVTAEGLYTDEGFPIVYENDGHGTLTGDTDIGIPGQPINLTTAYNTYYRLSGYDVTGGYVEDGKLYATAACTARAVYKPNAFTATGTFGYANKLAGGNPVTGNYNAVLKAFTGGKPDNWPAVNGNWTTNNASAYSFAWNTKVTMTGANGSPRETLRCYTQLRIGGSNKKQVNSVIGKLATTTTLTNTATNTTQGQPSLYCYCSAFYAGDSHGWTKCSPNAWTATGYAP